MDSSTVSARWIDEESVLTQMLASTFEPATVLFERINTGYGLERNRLGVQIRNNADQPVSAVWLEAWPHWIKAYMHTMHISVDGLPVETGQRPRQEGESDRLTFAFSSACHKKATLSAGAISGQT